MNITKKQKEYVEIKVKVDNLTTDIINAVVDTMNSYEDESLDAKARTLIIMRALNSASLHFNRSIYEQRIEKIDEAIEEALSPVRERDE